MPKDFLMEVRYRLLWEARGLLLTRFSLFYALGFYGLFIFYNLWYLNILERDQLVLLESVAVLPWLLAVFIPFLVLHSWYQEERKSSYYFFLASSLPSWGIVLIRYVVHAIYLGAVLALCWVFYLSLSAFGSLGFSSLLLAFLGHWLLSLFYLSLALAVCTFFAEMMLASFVSVICLLLANGLNPLILTLFFDSWVQGLNRFVRILAPYDHLDTFSMGVFRVGDCVYFLTLAAGFLMFKIAQVEGHRMGREIS